jgi:RNA polymerase sigma factor (sigma-70 family)
VDIDPEASPLHGLTTHSPQWWGAVYEAWAQHAYGGALAAYRSKSRVADASDVEDVVADVFVKFMETKGIDDETTSIPGVLYKAAYRRAIDRLRRDSQTTGSEPPDAPDQADPFEAVDDVDERIHLGGIVWDNLYRLDPRERQILRRCFQDGATHQQVAVELGISRVRVTQIIGKMIPKLIPGSADE